ncbi:MAG: sodium:proton antiporter [Planctomycetota bacterium]
MEASLITLAAGGGGTVPIAIGLLVLLGVGAQWLAWRLRVPSILLLLLFGILAGPVMRSIVGAGHPLVIDPDSIFGSDLLLALVGVSVGLILYEGGLTLNFFELRKTWRPVTLLVTIGAMVTWFVAGLSARWVLGLSWPLAVQLGAILIVTGPTVIGPLLSHIRPSGSTGLILKWEGIVIDPIGVGVAVLVFDVISLPEDASGFGAAAKVIGLTIVFGTLFGVVAAIVLRELMTRFLVPDSLQNPVSLMLVVATFTASNQVQAESGLLATTVMGIILANQKKVDVHHILEFKENLRMLLIALLFIVLAARLRLEDLQALSPVAVFVFLASLVVIARPASVFLATIGTGMSWRERLFLSWMAPRGIVAAAASSVFAIGLTNAGVEGGEQLIPLTFTVIIGTVAFYGLTAPVAARWLGVSDQNPQGVLFVGAPRWVRLLGRVLEDRGVRVVMMDTNRSNVSAARMAGLKGEHGNVLSIGDLSELDLRGIGRVFAVTPNDEVNTLVLQRFKGYFDTVGLYRLAPRADRPTDGDAADRRFRVLFDPEAFHQLIETRVSGGWVFKATTLSGEFSYRDFRSLYGPTMVPIASVSGASVVSFATANKAIAPGPGDTVIALVDPDELLMNPLGPDEGEGAGPPDVAAD